MLLHNGFYAIVSRGAPSNLSTRRNLASVWKRTVWKRRSFVVLRNAIIHGSQYDRFIGIRTSYPYELWLNTFTYLIRWKIWVDLCCWHVIRKVIWYVTKLRIFEILCNIYLFSSSCLCPVLAVSVLYLGISCVNIWKFVISSHIK